MSHHADIDIDFSNRDDILTHIKYTSASIKKNNKLVKHNSGIYVQPIPLDPVHNISAIPYQEADKRGYFKLDFLNMHVYDKIKNNKHYEQLLATEPPWERLVEKEFVKQIVHISNYSDLIAKKLPKTIPQMAMFIAVIRPAKKHLIDKSWKEISKTIWNKPDNNEYYFKQSHAISYAVLVALHMNIINEE